LFSKLLIALAQSVRALSPHAFVAGTKAFVGYAPTKVFYRVYTNVPSSICIMNSTRYVKRKEKSIGESCSQFIFAKSLRMGNIAGSVITYKNLTNAPSPS